MFPGQAVQPPQRGHKYQHQRDASVLQRWRETSRLIKRATISGTAILAISTAENERYRGPASVERL